MFIVGLDLSFESCGWAAWETGWPTPTYGHWVLAEDLKEHAALGCARLQKNLSAIVREHGAIDILAIERSVPEHKKRGRTNATTAWAQAGLELHALSFAVALGIRAHRVAINAWRAEFLGRMRTDSNVDLKTMAQNRARQLGMSTAVHDEAEAIGVLDYQMGQEGLARPWRVSETLQPMPGLEAA